MAVGFVESIWMLLRGSPVGTIRRILRKLDAAGISIDPQKLEAHALARGDIERSALAMVAAAEHDVVVEPDLIFALDLSGHDPVAAVEEAARPRAAILDHIAPDSDLPIEANCRDGSRFAATAHVTYALTVGYVAFGDRSLFPLHESFAVTTMYAIADADSPEHLLESKDDLIRALRSRAVQNPDGPLQGPPEIDLDFTPIPAS